MCSSWTGRAAARRPARPSSFRLSNTYPRRMYREREGENPDLDRIGPARPGEHPTDSGPAWMPDELYRWYLASKRAVKRRFEAAQARVRRRRAS